MFLLSLTLSSKFRSILCCKRLNQCINVKNRNTIFKKIFILVFLLLFNYKTPVVLNHVLCIAPEICKSDDFINKYVIFRINS